MADTNSNTTQPAQSQQAADSNQFQQKFRALFAPSERSKEQWESIAEEAESQRSNSENVEKIVHYHVSGKTFASLILGYGYLLLCAFIVLRYLYGFVKAFLYCDSNAVEPSLWTEAALIGGIIVFMILTVYDYWNVQIRVRMYVIALTCVFGVTIAAVWYKLVYAIVVPLLLIPEPNQFVTGAKWMFLIRILTMFPTIILTYTCVGAFVRHIVWDKDVLAQIEEFRLVEHIDLRRGKKYLYDMKILKNKFNGQQHVIAEDQRFLHMIVNGSTGTGKSSMILEPMANEDLKKRCQNEDKQISEVIKVLETGKAYLNRPIKGRYDFDISAVTPIDEKTAQKLEKIATTYKKIGYTVLCPDSSMTDHIAQLALAKGIDVNVVDPEYDEKTGKFKAGTKGFNPLYISPSVPESERQSVIASRAVLVAEILTKLNALKGEGDPYFVGLNRTVTESIAITLLVTFPILEHRQPNLVDIQLCINDFSRIVPYYNALVNINKAIDDHPYTFVCDFVSLHLIGDGKKEMVTQAKGLQMLVNEFLTQERVRFLLCAPDDATIDMDEMLVKGQITCVNYGLRFGPIISTGFGLFFMLSFINATMRRPGNEKTRIPHVFVIDELARCLHPDLESEISLARKYKVAFVGAIQSLSQFGQSPVTRYMEEVVLGGCAHHIIFGRCGVEEMDRYGKLAGKGYQHKEIDTVSETSITTDNPTYSYSKRTEMEEVDNLRAIDLSHKHFKECTVFTSREGAPLDPFFARVNFLDKSEYNTLKRKKIDWEELYEKYGVGSTAPGAKTVGAAEEKIEKVYTEEKIDKFDFTKSLFPDDSMFFYDDPVESKESAVNDETEKNEAEVEEIRVAVEEVHEDSAEAQTPDEKAKYVKLKDGYQRSDESGGINL